MRALRYRSRSPGSNAIRRPELLEYRWGLRRPLVRPELPAAFEEPTAAEEVVRTVLPLLPDVLRAMPQAREAERRRSAS